jgi:RNA polymerase sigma-70 factor (ECF subfamily)
MGTRIRIGAEKGLNSEAGARVEVMRGQTAELVRRAQAGDMEAFAEAFESLRPALYAVAARLVGPSDVDDVVMDTFLKAWQALPRFRGGCSLKTWLYRIAYNCGIDILRRRDRRKEQSLSQGEEDAGAEMDLPDLRQRGPDEIVGAQDGAEWVQAVLQKLPDEHRATLLLRFADGLSCREIAAATGVSVGTVLSRLFYGKRKLRRLIERAGMNGVK